MLTIVLVNPVRYSGYGYTKMIKNYFKYYRILALWPSKQHHKDAINAALNEIDEHLVYNDDWEQLLSDLSLYTIECFINGDDEGFVLADRLQAHYFPDHCNDASKQVYRSSKFEYLNYLRDAGIVKSRQFILTPETHSLCLNTNVVVKPTNGAGNINVHIKPSYDFVGELLNSNIEYMIQDYVEGPEYCMEICSRDGIHRCTMASLYKGEYYVDDIYPWREENELVSPDDTNISILYDYVVSILDALGIKLGLTWTQVKIDNGVPNLVEINFRSQGRAVIGPIYDSTGSHWAIESLRAYLKLHTTSPMMYKKLGDFNKICVNNYRERYIHEIDWSPIEELESVKFCEKYPQKFPGVIPVTKNFPGVLGMIMIQNNNTEQYQHDINIINLWKENIGR
jgi:hypothetical protein